MATRTPPVFGQAVFGLTVFGNYDTDTPIIEQADGSWWTLATIAREAADSARAERMAPLTECPNDFEELVRSPRSQRPVCTFCGTTW